MKEAVYAAMLTAGLLSTAFAGVDLPHTFRNGTPAEAEAVNANFAALQQAVEALEAQVGQRGLPIGTIIAWLR
jgi:hypothetical protein